MKNALFFLMLFLVSCLHIESLFGQGTQKEKMVQQFEKSKQLIVAIYAEVDGDDKLGAGIIVGRKKDEILIATAYHVLHTGNVQANKIRVKFRSMPDKYFTASLLKYSTEETLDLALISIKGQQKEGLNECSIPFDRLGDISNLKPNDGVFPLGNPNGQPWAMPVVPDKIADVLGTTISFQSSFISNGNSGGALLDTSAGIVALVIADQPPFGRAISIKNILDKVTGWGYAVYLRTRDFRGQTPLHIAAKNGHIDEMKKLLSECYNVNQRDDHHATPLHFAAAYSKEAVKFLISEGADLNLLDADGDPPLEWADENKDVENIRLLVAAGAQWTRFSPLILAGIKGDLTKVRTLVKESKNVNYTDDHQATPLHYFAAYASEPAVDILIKSGASITAKDEDEMEPAGWSAKSGRIDNLKLFLKLIDPKEQISIKKDLVRYAIAKGQVEVVKFLIESGVDLKQINGNASEDYLLTNAIKNRQYRMMEFLIKVGMSPNVGKGFSDGPLMSAADLGDIEAIKILKKAGADINISDQRGYNSLDIVFEKKWKPAFMTEVLGALLSNQNGQIKPVLGSNWSFGLLFVNRHNENFVVDALKMLLAAGANVNTEQYVKDDDEARTPLFIALQNGYAIAARYLREHGGKK